MISVLFILLISENIRMVSLGLRLSSTWLTFPLLDLCVILWPV